MGHHDTTPQTPMHQHHHIHHHRQASPATPKSNLFSSFLNFLKRDSSPRGSSRPEDAYCSLPPRNGAGLPPSPAFDFLPASKSEPNGFMSEFSPYRRRDGTFDSVSSVGGLSLNGSYLNDGTLNYPKPKTPDTPTNIELTPLDEVLQIEHHFQAVQLHNLTWCDVCGELIWGLVYQSLKCVDCQFTCHHNCRHLVVLDCPRRDTGDGEIISLNTSITLVTDVPTASTGYSSADLSLDSSSVSSTEEESSPVPAESRVELRPIAVAKVTPPKKSYVKKVRPRLSNDLFSPKAANRRSIFEGNDDKDIDSPNNTAKLFGIGKDQPTLDSVSGALDLGQVELTLSDTLETELLNNGELLIDVDEGFRSSSPVDDGTKDCDSCGKDDKSGFVTAREVKNWRNDKLYRDQRSASPKDQTLPSNGSNNNTHSSSGTSSWSASCSSTTLPSVTSESTISNAPSGSNSMPNGRTLTKENLSCLVADFNRRSKGLSLDLLEDGLTVRGFIRVHLDLMRPVSVSSEQGITFKANAGDSWDSMTSSITSFHIPQDTIKNLHISSETTVKEVVEALLKKYAVTDHPKKFALFEKSLHISNTGKTMVSSRRLHDFECPLMIFLCWGADLINQRKFVLQENETGEILWEAFSLPELNTFLRILDHEEKEYEKEVMERYRIYQQQLLIEMNKHEKIQGYSNC